MKKILIIDDEKDVITYLDTLFKNNGYDTISADNADDGIEKAKTEKPDLVSLDIVMPGKSGIKVYRTLRDDEQLKSIPVIVVTAATGYRNDPQEFKKFLSTRKHYPPPDGFVPKPIDKEELINRVKDLIG
jgi:CheY-like chemotaxis protein